MANNYIIGIALAAQEYKDGWDGLNAQLAKFKEEPDLLGTQDWKAQTAVYILQITSASNRLRNLNYGDNKRLRRMCHDVARMYSAAMLLISQGLDKGDTEKIGAASEKIRKEHSIAYDIAEMLRGMA